MTPERIYTIECEGYFDKNGDQLDDEISIKLLTNGEQVDVESNLELYDENGDRDYNDNDDYFMIKNKYDLLRIIM